MFLVEGLPNSISVGGVLYKIETSARFWIVKTIQLENVADKKKIDVLLSCLVDKTLKIESNLLLRFVKQIQLFFTSNWDKINDYIPTQKSNSNKLYDYAIDSGRIYSAFYKTYGIDIESMLDHMHWWKFMSMFNDLSDESSFKGIYMHYRSYDKSQKEYREMKPENKIKIDEIINRVSFIENDVLHITSKKSSLDIRREEAKSNGDK